MSRQHDPRIFCRYASDYVASERLTKRRSEEIINKAGRSTYPIKKSVLRTEATRHVQRRRTIARSGGLGEGDMNVGVGESFPQHVLFAWRAGLHGAVPGPPMLEHIARSRHGFWTVKGDQLHGDLADAFNVAQYVGLWRTWLLDGAGCDLPSNQGCKQLEGAPFLRFLAVASIAGTEANGWGKGHFVRVGSTAWLLQLERVTRATDQAISYAHTSLGKPSFCLKSLCYKRRNTITKSISNLDPNWTPDGGKAWTPRGERREKF